MLTTKGKVVLENGSLTTKTPEREFLEGECKWLRTIVHMIHVYRRLSGVKVVVLCVDLYVTVNELPYAETNPCPYGGSPLLSADTSVSS